MTMQPTNLALQDDIKAALDKMCVEFIEKSHQLISAQCSEPTHESKAQALERACAVHRTVVHHANRGLAHVIRQQNALAPMNRLPLDVFASILRLSMDKTIDNCTTWFSEMGDELPEVKEIPYYDKLRSLRLVSSLWADLIAETPTLWTYLKTDQPPATTQDALSRSQSSPLTINIEGWKPIVYIGEPVARFLDQVSPHAHRWSCLEITGPRGRAWFFNQTSPSSLGMDAFFPTPLTSLQILRLHLVQETDDPSIPLSLSKEDLPALREVEITGLRTVRWPWQVLVGLRSLHLARISSEALPSYQQLVGILSASPKLLVLTLEDMDVISDSRSASLPALPNLRHLRLSGLPEDLVTALLYLAQHCKSVHLGLTRPESLEALEASAPVVAAVQYLTSALLSSSPTSVDVAISGGFHIDNVTLTFSDKSWTLVVIPPFLQMPGKHSSACHLLHQIRFPATVTSTSVSIPIIPMGGYASLDYNEILETMSRSLPATDRLLLRQAGDLYWDESSRILRFINTGSDRGRPLLPHLRQMVIARDVLGVQGFQSLVGFAQERIEARQAQVQGGVPLAEQTMPLASLTIDGVSQMTMATVPEWQGVLDTLRSFIPLVKIVPKVVQGCHAV